MPIIRISRSDLEKMSDDQLEETLQGSGKPAGVPFSINDEEISWGDTLAAMQVGQVTVEITNEPEVPIDYKSLTKEEIEHAVLERHGVNLNTRLNTKAMMIKKAEKLDAEAANASS